MSFVGKTTLKGYFNAGDVPTESNFADLVDSCHQGHGSFQLVASASADTAITGDGDATGGIILLNDQGTAENEFVLKLPEASTNNIGLSYKVIIGNNAANVRIGPDGTTTKLTGSLNVACDAAAKTLFRAADVGATHVSLSVAEAGKGGATGSVIEFFYNSATGVNVFGTVFTDNASTKAADLYGTGDIG